MIVCSLLLAPVCGFAQAGRSLSRERGQVATQSPDQWVDRGRLGTQPSLPQGPSEWSGLLFDAGCADRGRANLLSPPAVATAVEPPTSQARGISVSPQTLRAERGEATLPDTPDHASRYASASCAITAETKAFALLLPDGTVLDLNEAGNTLALEAFQSTPAGQQILNGKTGGLKPLAKIKGLRQGDRLEAGTVEIGK